LYGAVHIQPFKKSLQNANVPTWEVIFTAIEHIVITHMRLGARRGVVVKALRYIPAGRGFDSASNRNEYQVYFLGVKVADA
jgi:hypothetical protein